MKRKCNIAKFILSPNLIDQMTKKKYYLKINKIRSVGRRNSVFICARFYSFKFRKIRYNFLTHNWSYNDLTFNNACSNYCIELKAI